MKMLGLAAALAIIASLGYVRSSRCNNDAKGVAYAGSDQGRNEESDKGKAEMTTLQGELVDLVCYLDQGAKGASHKACAAKCAGMNLPVGLLTNDGDLYLVLAADHKPTGDLCKGKMVNIVSITGKVADKGGLKAIFASEIKTIKEVK